MLPVTTSCVKDAMTAMRKPYADVPLHKHEDVSYEKEEGSIRLVQYNVGAFHKSGSSSLDMVSSMTKELEADVIGLNEVDSVTTRTGRVDQIKEFAEKLGGWNYKYACAMAYHGGEYGVGVCASTKFRLVSTDNIHLPQAGSEEPRAMAVMEFDDFVFATAHLSLVEAARLEQIDVINAYFNQKYPVGSKPVFLSGDFNSRPDSETLKKLSKTWRVISDGSFTSPAIKPSICIDYVVLRDNGANVVVRKSVVCKEFVSGSVTTASDHLPVFVDIVL